jgi:hypothetical protein
MDDMTSITMIEKGPLWPDYDWEDKISSFVGLANNRLLNLYQHDDRGGKVLRVNPAFADDVAVLVGTLHSQNPASDPAGAIRQDIGAPSGGWGNKISSFKWDAAR